MQSTQEVKAIVEKPVSAIANVNPSVGDVNIDNLINLAITNNVNVETLERLMTMRDKLKSEWAQEQYYSDMAKFQNECPTIRKTKSVPTKDGKMAYKYAPLEQIIKQVKPLLDKYGFSYTTKMELKPDGVKVVVVCQHRCGHTEETPMEVPFGAQTKIMSQTQVVAAATTFAKRYAFINAFGIMTADDDNDGAIHQMVDKPEPKQKTPYEIAMEVITKTNNYEGLREMREKIEKSLKYSQKNKDELLKAIDDRLAAINSTKI